MKCVCICPPNIQAQLTGAWRCEKARDTTTLHYLDGTTETVRTAAIPKETDWTNWFSIVGMIQSLRSAGHE